MFNLFRRHDTANRRTAFVATGDGCALATVRRAAGGRRILEVCRTVRGGPAAQQEAIAAWLAADRGDLGALSTVLDAADYQLLLVETPDVLPAELRAAVRWRLKDAIDFPVDDAVVDVFEIPEQVRRTGSRMMYAVAARRQAVERQIGQWRPATRGFDVIDIPELALRNLVALLPEAAEGLILLWHHAGSAQLLVIKQTTLYLARHVHSATATATSSGAEAQGAVVEAIALELQRSMDYFESHYEQAAIRHLVIAPGGPRAEELAAALATETAMRTAVIDLTPVIDLAAGIDMTDSSSLLALGAALRDDQRKL